jgi:hypothetical protein
VGLNQRRESACRLDDIRLIAFKILAHRFSLSLMASTVILG